MDANVTFENLPASATSSGTAVTHANSAAGSASAADRKSACPAPASLPPQPALLGIRFDFNQGGSCWNDARQRFDRKDFLWCPRRAGTPRQLECTRLITPTQVIAALRRIPGLMPPAATGAPGIASPGQPAMPAPAVSAG